MFNDLFNKDDEERDFVHDLFLRQMIPGYHNYRWFRKSPKTFIGFLIAIAVFTFLVALYIVGSAVWILFIDNESPQPKKTSQYSQPQIQTEWTLDETEPNSPILLTVPGRCSAGGLPLALGIRTRCIGDRHIEEMDFQNDDTKWPFRPGRLANQKNSWPPEAVTNNHWTSDLIPHRKGGGRFADHTLIFQPRMNDRSVKKIVA